MGLVSAVMSTNSAGSITSLNSITILVSSSTEDVPLGVINVASELGFLGRAAYAPYCAAKAGVIGLTRSLAREFAPAIRVNAIAPGPVDTPMLSVEHMSPEVLESERAIPARRIGRPEEIAAAAVFLASENASFFDGQVLGPNGGAYMG